jgi:two-component system phosphate regulon sensor histidine kinase PhoR
MRRLLDHAARLGMGRLFAAVLPLLTVAAALLGVLLKAVVPAVVLALLLGLVATVLVIAVVSTHARVLARRVDQAARGDVSTERVFEGREEWRELAEAIDRMSASLHTQAEQIVEQRVRSQRLLEELPSAVLLLHDVVIAYANRAARELFGIASDAMDSDFASIGPPGLVAAVVEAAETGRSIDVELEHNERTIAARATTLGPGEVVLVIRDMTSVRRLDAVRRDFVVNASHELKTPVAGIQALAESLSLALRHSPGRAARMVGRIELEAARLARLVRDLLDLARLEELDGSRQRGRVNVADVVRGQLHRMEPLAAKRDISINCHLPDSSVVIAVPEDIRSIVANLLENAVRYNRDGGTVDVILARDDGSVTFEVTDTGEGIPEQDRDRIFERFYRVDKGRSRAAGGTGLGLSLVRHATERHGGTVTLHSEVGVGSTFRVKLPVAGDDA